MGPAGGGGPGGGAGGPMEKKNNVLPIWGNEKTMNLNNMILTNILSSHYFKVNLYQLKTYHEVVDEIFYNVSHLEPWEKGSRKTSGQTGMCGGVRGVGAGGIVSTAFCILYKLFTLKLTRKQLVGLITHCDSPYIRGLGFMYIRYTQPPADLWEWYEYYLDDDEELDVKAGGGQVMQMGEVLRHLLSKLEWFSTLFPRIPVPIQKELERKLSTCKPLTAKDDERGPGGDNDEAEEGGGGGEATNANEMLPEDVPESGENYHHPHSHRQEEGDEDFDDQLEAAKQKQRKTSNHHYHSGHHHSHHRHRSSRSPSGGSSRRSRESGRGGGGGGKGSGPTKEVARPERDGKRHHNRLVSEERGQQPLKDEDEEEERHSKRNRGGSGGTGTSRDEYGRHQHHHRGRGGEQPDKPDKQSSRERSRSKTRSNSELETGSSSSNRGHYNRSLDDVSRHHYHQHHRGSNNGQKTSSSHHSEHRSSSKSGRPTTANSQPPPHQHSHASSTTGSTGGRRRSDSRERSSRQRRH